LDPLRPGGLEKSPINGQDGPGKIMGHHSATCFIIEKIIKYYLLFLNK
jgi:hypothetical protein